MGAYQVPTDAPESDGTLKWDSTTLVLVRLDCQEHTGLGYSYAHASVASLIHSKLRPVVEGRDPFEGPALWLEMLDCLRNLGRPGLTSYGVAAVDVALWDLKARLLGLPLVDLLGRARSSIPIYGSGGFTSYDLVRLREQLSGWVDEGISMVKMKVGRHPEDDPERVRVARQAIGDGPDLFVDANGGYRRKQALELARRFHEEAGVSWFEEPVPSDDLAGLRLIRDRGPAGLDVTAGEYGYRLVYFRRMLEAGAVDVMQADATRCAGVTGFLQVAALCRAFQVPLSAHCAPTLHASVCCACLPVCHLEYFHDHVRIEQMLFDGVPALRQGGLVPALDRPGLGIEFRERDAQRFAVN
ncbi:MAG: enolase C-terminal domain-like protein [Vulcanimicrobiota bacterium]